MTVRGIRTGVLAFALPVVFVIAFSGPDAAFASYNPDTGGPAPTTAPTVTVTTTTTATTTAAATVPTVCRAPARRGFWPLRARVAHVGKRVPVLDVGRTNRVPNTPPLTSLGKRSFGWDRKGPAPGSHHGNVRFNAHTYPDGSALGNRMLARLKVGARIIVRGSGTGICYRVTKRISVKPRSYAARVTYYRTTGKPRLAIVVCSGTRLGPGNWTRRTIWYAKPSTS
jgi:hypothetical protein